MIICHPARRARERVQRDGVDHATLEDDRSLGESGTESEAEDNGCASLDNTFD